MDLNDLRTLFDYNAWANRRTLEACARLSQEQFLQDLKSSFPSVRDTLVHIYGGETIWLNRLRGHSPAGFPNAADFPDCASISASLMQADAALIDHLTKRQPESLTEEVEYKLLNGNAAKGLPGPMLQHLANHGTYHRGQIATLLRQLGAPAASTDMIGYYRELASRASA